VLFLVAAMTAPFGCDSASFVPPPPEELAENPGAGATDAGGGSPQAIEPAAAKTLEVFLDRCTAEVGDVLQSSARSQAGLDLVKLDINVLGEADPPTRQVDLVREALARNPLALVIEPAIPPDHRLAEVVSEARASGVPVVLLNRPLAGSQPTAAGSNSAKSLVGVSAASAAVRQRAETATGSPSSTPMVLVKPAPFQASAEQIVTSAVRNAENAHLDPRGGVLLVINTLGDPFVHDRVAAIRTALKGAGITKVQEVSFSKDSEAGSKLVTAKLEADPKLALVLGVDSMSSLAGREVMLKIVLDRPFILAGYAGDDTYTASTRMGDFAALAVYSPPRLVRKAISTAMALAHGRDMPAVIELPIEVTDSPPESATAKSPVFYKKQHEKSQKNQ
jgi:ABC-type sugar transport system substrate-binding protein